MNSNSDNIQNICRICLGSSCSMKSFSDITTEANDIIEKLSAVFSGKIEIDEKFPSNICHECEEKMNISYNFQQLGLKSQQFLLQYREINIINDVDDINRVNVGSVRQDAISSVIDEDDTEASNETDNVSEKIKDNQIMRLNQYAAEEVEIAITKIREKYFSRESVCIFCQFIAKGPRALSVHMSRLHKSKKNIWCSLCNIECVNLPLHMKDSHKDDLECQFCSKAHKKTSHLIEHLSSHTKQRKFNCAQCKKSFTSNRRLEMHQNQHLNRLKCNICERTFLFKKSLNLHLEKHNTLNCNLCLNGFVDKADFENHNCSTKDVINELESSTTTKEITTERRNYCKLCNKRVRSLGKHILQFHQAGNLEMKLTETATLCTYCGKQFRSPSKLTVHMRCHTGETPHKCAYCNLRLSTRGHLVAHERTHTGEKPYVCSVCGKAFAQSSVRNTHMRIHTGRPVPCMLCPKRFCRYSELRQHMRTHSGEKPYLCTQCGKTFKQRSHLVEHSKTHTNDRPYQCEYCDKSFKRMTSLKIHSNVHVVEKRNDCLIQEKCQPSSDTHKCAICLETFATLSLFTDHYNNKHEPVMVHDLLKDVILTREIPSTTK